MNPAALKANIADLPAGGVLIVNTDEFTKRNLTKVGYAANPLEDGSLEQLHGAPGRDGHAHPRRAGGDRAVARRTPSGRRTCSRSACCRGCTTGRTEGTERFLREKFAKPPGPRRGQHPGVQGRARLRRDHRGVRRHLRGRAGPARRRAPTARSPATPRWPTGIVAAGQVTGLPVFLGSYPITPASDILHELSKHKAFDVTTFQAEDEIAGVGAALGAAFGGALGVTTTSGPGHLAQVRDDRRWRWRWSCRCW